MCTSLKLTIPQLLKTKWTIVNRAPLMTAWATVVAERMGFEREEALSIGMFLPGTDYLLSRVIIFPPPSQCVY